MSISHDIMRKAGDRANYLNSSLYCRLWQHPKFIYKENLDKNPFLYLFLETVVCFLDTKDLTLIVN